MPLLSAKKSPAFTLIELLAAVAVVSILVALTIPAISKIRSSSYTAQCASNLRQIHAAILLYANDNNDTLPGPTFMGLRQSYYYSPTARTTTLSAYLHDYLSPTSDSNKGKNNWVQGAFICPAWEASGGGKTSIPTPYVLNVAPWPSSLPGGGHNVCPFGNANNSSDSASGQPRRLSEIAQFPLSSTWMLVDGDNTFLREVMSYAASANYLDNPVHGVATNTLFFDGRVENIPLTEFKRYP